MKRKLFTVVFLLSSLFQVFAQQQDWQKEMDELRRRLINLGASQQDLRNANMMQLMYIDSLQNLVRHLGVQTKEYEDILATKAVMIAKLDNQTRELNDSLRANKNIILLGFVIAAILLATSIVLVLILRKQIKTVRELTKQEEEEIKSELHVTEDRLISDEKKFDLFDNEHRVEQMKIRNEMNEINAAMNAKFEQFRKESGDMMARLKGDVEDGLHLKSADLNKKIDEAITDIHGKLANIKKTIDEKKE